jgi:hypothetical protein
MPWAKKRMCFVTGGIGTSVRFWVQAKMLSEFFLMNLIKSGMNEIKVQFDIIWNGRKCTGNPKAMESLVEK